MTKQRLILSFVCLALIGAGISCVVSLGKNSKFQVIHVHNGAAMAVAVSNDESLLASSGGGARIELFRRGPEIRQLKSLSSANIHRLQFSENGKILVASGSLGISIFDPIGNGKQRDLYLEKYPWAFCFCKDGHIAVAIENKIHIYNPDTFNEVGLLPAECAAEDWFYEVVPSPCGQYLAANTYWNCVVHVWDVNSKELIWKSSEQNTSGRSLVFLKDGRLLVQRTTNGVFQSSSRLIQIDYLHKRDIDLGNTGFSTFGIGKSMRSPDDNITFAWGVPDNPMSNWVRGGSIRQMDPQTGDARRIFVVSNSGIKDYCLLSDGNVLAALFDGRVVFGKQD